MAFKMWTISETLGLGLDLTTATQNFQNETFLNLEIKGPCVQTHTPNKLKKK